MYKIISLFINSRNQSFINLLIFQSGIHGFVHLSNIQSLFILSFSYMFSGCLEVGSGRVGGGAGGAKS